MAPKDELAALVAEELARPAPPGAHALSDLLRSRYGSNLRAVLFYGSCQRRGVDDEGILDLYALVGNYRDAFSNPLLVLANTLLPPNVFYLEARDDDRAWRSKYAVLSLSDLTRRTTKRTSEPYFWARFAQPCTLLWVADETARGQVIAALVQSIETFLEIGLPFMAAEFACKDLWVTMWRHTYRAELRAERPEVVEKLWGNAAERYERVTELALARIGGATHGVDPGRWRRLRTTPTPQQAERSWALRVINAKLRFVLRILRNALIFEGGVDYALWKIARHSDVAIDPKWREKPWPIASLLAQLWRLYRAGAFR